MKKINSYKTELTENANFALIIKDNHLEKFRICKDDILFFKATDNLKNGNLVAVLDDKKVKIGLVVKSSNERGFYLYTEYQKTRNLEYFGDKLDKIKILGVAIAFQSKIIYKEQAEAKICKKDTISSQQR